MTSLSDGSGDGLLAAEERRSRSVPWGPMSLPELTGRLESLRAHRVSRDAAASSADIFHDQGATLAKLERSLGDVGAAWAKTCPEELHAKSSILSLKRGVLTIGAEDSPTRFELDRHLRSGGERALIRASSASVRRIKVVLDSRPISPAPPGRAPR